MPPLRPAGRLTVGHRAKDVLSLENETPQSVVYYLNPICDRAAQMGLMSRKQFCVVVSY